MYPRLAPTATPAMVIPSISTRGSPSITMRSENVPESPSSALHTTYFWSAEVFSTVFHLIPVGKAAPPLPRRPDWVTASTTSAGVISSARRSPRYPLSAS